MKRPKWLDPKQWGFNEYIATALLFALVTILVIAFVAGILIDQLFNYWMLHGFPWQR